MLADTRFFERIGRFTRVQIEDAHCRGELGDCLLCTDEKERGDADRDQGHRAEHQSQRA